MTKRVAYVIVYNIFAVIFLFGVIETTTRTISWLKGKGFTLSLHELEPYAKEIKDIYQWHPFTGFTFTPSNEFTGSHPNQKKKAKIFVDGHGFLAKDDGLEYTKPHDEIRIAAIGGSTTASISLSYDKNWPGYLGNLVQKKFPNKHVRVINAGVPGFDSAQSIGNLSLRVMPFKPDIVIIYHAYNDLKAIRPDTTFRPDYSHFHTKPYGFYKEPNLVTKALNRSMFYVRTRNRYQQYKKERDQQERIATVLRQGRISHIPKEALDSFRQHIRCLVSIARGERARVILSSFATLHNPELDWSRPETFELQSKFQKDTLTDLLHFTPGLTIQGIFDGFRQYNEVLKEVAAREQCGWVDNARLVAHEDKYFVDRVHFSPSGARRMAENLLPVVEEMLRGSDHLL